MLIYKNKDIGKVLFGANELQRVYYGHTLVFEKCVDGDNGYVDEYPDADIVLEWINTSTTSTVPSTTTAARTYSNAKLFGSFTTNSSALAKYSLSNYFINGTNITKCTIGQVNTGNQFRSYSVRLSGGFLVKATSDRLKKVIKLPIKEDSVLELYVTSLEYMCIEGWVLGDDVTIGGNEMTDFTTIEGNATIKTNSLNLGYAPNLTYESAKNVIRSLYNDTQQGHILGFNYNTYSKLSEEDIATASLKGWTITA